MRSGACFAVSRIVCGCAPSTGAISCAVSISLSDALISAIVILRSLPFCFIYSVGLLIPLCCIARKVAGVQRKCDHQFPQSFGPKSSPLLIAGDLGKMVEYWLDVWLGIWINTSNVHKNKEKEMMYDFDSYTLYEIKKRNVYSGAVALLKSAAAPIISSRQQKWQQICTKNWE